MVGVEGGIGMRQKGTPPQMARCWVHIPQPQRHNCLSVALQFAWLNVAMC